MRLESVATCFTTCTSVPEFRYNLPTIYYGFKIPKSRPEASEFRTLTTKTLLPLRKPFDVLQHALVDPVDAGVHPE